jgi:hypothetical protein
VVLVALSIAKPGGGGYRAPRTCLIVPGTRVVGFLKNDNKLALPTPLPDDGTPITRLGFNGTDGGVATAAVAVAVAAVGGSGGDGDGVPVDDGPLPLVGVVTLVAGGVSLPRLSFDVSHDAILDDTNTTTFDGLAVGDVQ